MTQFPPPLPTPSQSSEPSLGSDRELYCRGCAQSVTTLGVEAGQCPACGRAFDLRHPLSTRSWPRPSASERARTRLVWAVLALLVTGIAVMQAMNYAPPIPGSLPPSEDVQSPVLKVMGKVGIGLNAMPGGADALKRTGQDNDLGNQIDQSSLNVIDLVRAVPLVGWIEDPAAAESRLDALDSALTLEASWRTELMENLHRATSTLESREGPMTPADRDPIVVDAERLHSDAERELEAMRLAAKSSFTPLNPVVKSRLEGRVAAGAKLRSIGSSDSRSDAEEELKEWTSRVEAGASEVARLRDDAATLRLILADGSKAVPATQMDELRRRHGWFADVAAARDAPSTDAIRRQIEAKGQVAVAFLVLALGVIVSALLVGVVLLILLLIRLNSGKLRCRLPWDQARFEPTRGILLETITLFLAGFVLVQMLVAVIRHLWKIDTSHGVVWGLLLIAGWPVLRRLRWEQTRLAIGWHTGRGVLREMGAGIVGYLAGLPLVFASFLVAFVLIQLLDQRPTHPVVEDLGNSSVWTLVSMFILATVWAPVVEETMFRGAFYSHLRRVAHPIVAALVVGFVFAIIHPQGIGLVPPLMTLGAVFAFIREWRGSLIGPITAHAVHNGFLVTLMAILFS